jgi:hypothetical protein
MCLTLSSLYAILETQKQIPNWVRQIFEKELAYKEENVKHIKDE